MKPARSSLIALTAGVLAVALVVALSAHARGPSEALPHDRVIPGPPQSTHKDYGYSGYDGDPLDLQGCQQHCRSIFGVDPYFSGKRSFGKRYNTGYAICIQECNSKYWDAWDAHMEGLDK